MNIWLFGVECAAVLFGVVVWSWWAYETDEVPPVVILLVAMGETAFVIACLTFVCVLTFGD